MKKEIIKTIIIELILFIIMGVGLKKMIDKYNDLCFYAVLIRAEQMEDIFWEGN